MPFDTDEYVDSFLLPNLNHVDRRSYDTLINALSARGFGSAQQGKDGYGKPTLLLRGTQLRCREQHTETFNEGENQFLTLYTLYYQNQFLAEHKELDGDSYLLIDEKALASLPEHLVDPVATEAHSAETPAIVLEGSHAKGPYVNTSSTASSVLRRAFVADQKETPDYNAPDGSEITYLIKGQSGDSGDLCKCKLPVGKTSTAVKHQTVQELWNFTAGQGEFWLQDGETETVHPVKAGTSILIHAGVSFQFRNLSEDTVLESTITTMPPWPGPNEAVFVTGRWEPTLVSVKETASSTVLPSAVKGTMFGQSGLASTGSAGATSGDAPQPAATTKK